MARGVEVRTESAVAPQEATSKQNPVFTRLCRL